MLLCHKIEGWHLQIFYSGKTSHYFRRPSSIFIVENANIKINQQRLPQNSSLIIIISFTIYHYTFNNSNHFRMYVTLYVTFQ